MPKELILTRSALVKGQFEKHDDKDTPFFAEIELDDYFDKACMKAMVDVSNTYVQLLIRDEVVTSGCTTVSDSWQSLVELYAVAGLMEDPISMNMVIDEMKATLRIGMPSIDAILHDEDFDHNNLVPDPAPRRLIVDHIAEHGELPEDTDGDYGDFVVSDLWKQIAHAFVAARNAPNDRATLDADGMDKRYYVPT